MDEAEQLAKKQRETLRRIIAMAKPVLEQRASEYRKRDVEVSLVYGADGASVVFDVRYPDGGYYGFSISDRGVMERSADGEGDGREISLPVLVDDTFERTRLDNLLEETHKNFMYHVSQHGGI